MSDCTNKHPDWSWSDCNQAATRSYNNCMAAAGLPPGSPPKIGLGNVHRANGTTIISAGSATPTPSRRPVKGASVAAVKGAMNASPSPTATVIERKKEKHKNG